MSFIEREEVRQKERSRRPGAIDKKDPENKEAFV